MSEDHAWVVFGRNSELSAEVTWHEKRSGDRRGEDVCRVNCEDSWVYAGGKPVLCDRNMEVAAIVSQVSCLYSSYGGYGRCYGYGGYGGYGFSYSRGKRSTDSYSLASHHVGGPVVSSVPYTYSSVHQPTSVQVGNSAPYFSTMQHSAPGFTSHLPAYTSIHHS